MKRTLLIIPTLREGAPILEELGGFQKMQAGSFPIFRSERFADRLFLSYCGIGSSQAAICTTACLTTLEVDRVLLVGVAGVLRGQEIEMGGLVFAMDERYLRLGSVTQDSYDDLSRRFSLDPFKSVESQFQLLAPADSTLGFSGCSFGTSDWLTATTEELKFLEKNHPSVHVENMEGAAVAHACFLWNKPLVEIRAIVNHIGQRDSSAWHWNSGLQALKKLGRTIGEDRI